MQCQGLATGGEGRLTDHSRSVRVAQIPFLTRAGR